MVKALLAAQTSRKPSLTVLAYIEEPAPQECWEALVEGRDLEVSLGELCPALIVGDTKTALAPSNRGGSGGAGQDTQRPATVQAIARQLQAEVANCDPVLDRLLRHWSDSADIGIVEK